MKHNLKKRLDIRGAFICILSIISILIVCSAQLYRPIEYKFQVNDEGNFLHYGTFKLKLSSVYKAPRAQNYGGNKAIQYISTEFNINFSYTSDIVINSLQLIFYNVDYDNYQYHEIVSIGNQSECIEFREIGTYYPIIVVNYTVDDIDRTENISCRGAQFRVDSIDILLYNIQDTVGVVELLTIVGISIILVCATLYVDLFANRRVKK